MKYTNTLSIISNSIRQYKLVTPTFYKILDLMEKSGCKYDGSIDHIAFRSFKSNKGIDNIRKVLLDNDEYTERDEFEFPEKHLSARWYSSDNYNLPTVFVSQINEERLSEESQNIIKSYVKDIKIHKFDGVSKGSDLWNPVLSSDYYKLAKESEYAAWTLAFGYSLNHVTIPVHKLSCYNNIKDYVNLLSDNDFKLLNEGTIQTSDDKLLLQTSTLADTSNIIQENLIPSTFVEFIERKVDSNHQLREGFDPSNANNIFESTNIQ